MVWLIVVLFAEYVRVYETKLQKMCSSFHESITWTFTVVPNTSGKCHSWNYKDSRHSNVESPKITWIAHFNDFLYRAPTIWNKFYDNFDFDDIIKTLFSSKILRITSINRQCSHTFCVRKNHWEKNVQKNVFGLLARWQKWPRFKIPA